MSLKYAVVTGGNKGIGFEICKQLASKGVKVILTARNVQRGTEAVEKLKACGLSDKVVFHQLDVTDSVSVDALAEFITTQFGKLDILVNNAGVGGITYISDKFRKVCEQHKEVQARYISNLSLLICEQPHSADIDWSEVYIQTYDMAEECIQTNYYGATLMIKALLPLLQLSDSARIVNISSIAGSSEYISNEWAKEVLSDIENLTEDRIKEVLDKFLKDFKDDSLKNNGWPTDFSAYILSKVAMNAHTRLIAKAYPSILTNCVHPGLVKTDISQNSGDLTAEEGAVFPVKLALLPNGAPSGLYYSEGNVHPF